MPNSRTPKKTLRPIGSTWKLGESLKIVFVEAVRSAAPPNSSGTTFSIACITAWPALRVAIGLSVGKVGIFFSHPSAILRLHDAFKLRRRLRIRLLVLRKLRRPFSVRLLAAQLGLVPSSSRPLPGHRSVLSSGQPRFFFVAFTALRTKRLTVHLVRAGLRAAIADHRPHPDQRRLRRLRLRRKNRLLNRHQIVAVVRPCCTCQWYASKRFVTSSV